MLELVLELVLVPVLEQVRRLELVLVQVLGQLRHRNLQLLHQQESSNRYASISQWSYGRLRRGNLERKHYKASVPGCL